MNGGTVPFKGKITQVEAETTAVLRFPLITVRRQETRCNTCSGSIFLLFISIDTVDPFGRTEFTGSY